MASETSKELRFVSLNVRGLNNNNKRYSVYNWLKMVNITCALFRRHSVHHHQVVNFKRGGQVICFIVLQILPIAEVFVLC